MNLEPNIAFLALQEMAAVPDWLESGGSGTRTPLQGHTHCLRPWFLYAVIQIELKAIVGIDAFRSIWNSP
jgi:hypothetical protein